MPKLTKRFIDAVRPGDREIFVWDDDLPGFGLRVLPSGRRSYLVQYRAKGRTRRLTLGPHGVLTPKQARERASRLLAEVRDGGDPSADRHAELRAPSVADFAKRYLEQHAGIRKKSSSLEGDKRNLKLHVLPRLGRTRIGDVTRADVTALHHSLRDRPYLANRVLALLSKMFNLAERWEIRPDGSNPCRHVERYPERKRERFLSSAELGRLGEALAKAEAEASELPSAIAAIRLLVLTGARRGEILGLRWENVDLEGQRLVLTDTKTGPKVIPVNSPALQVLQGLYKSRDPFSPWVIAGVGPGRPLAALHRPWDRIRSQAELPAVRLHDLRHSFASVAAGSGQTLHIIGKLLGHSQPATTHRYAHLADDPLREASEAVGRRIATALEGPERREDWVRPLRPKRSRGSRDQADTGRSESALSRARSG
jgi:integrase